jgi:3-oxoacyl-[acyl-carrier protein] reductase
MNELSNKVAVITGASRGIGRVIALHLAREGAKVALVWRNQSIEPVIKEIRDLGAEAEGFQADISKKEQVDDMVKKILNFFSKIDILVNNAGMTKDNLLVTMKQDEWENVINTNLFGVYNCSKAVLRPMIKQRSGKIINISSIVGLIGNPGQTNYAAAKAGIIGFSKALAKEIASRNIYVNVIAPGFIETQMTQELNNNVKENLLRKIPLGRFGKPEDVAELVIFLASEKSNYITGQVFVIDGGMTM